MSALDNADVVTSGDLAALERRATEVATRLSLVASGPRLMVLCHLAKLELEGTGEASVGTLQQAVGLSQSALSQHLARLREAGMVATRREAQTVHYRLADDETRRLMRALHEIFCEG